jgi:hypothetical protein
MSSDFQTWVITAATGVLALRIIVELVRSVRRRRRANEHRRDLDEIDRAFKDLNVDEMKQVVQKLLRKYTDEAQERATYIPPHVRPLSHIMGMADGAAPTSLRSLREARMHDDAYVIIEGDEGGQIYVVAPVSRIFCGEAELHALRVELDALEWGGEESSAIFYERRPKNTGVPGGMGGGFAGEDIWIHPRIAEKGRTKMVHDRLSTPPPPSTDVETPVLTATLDRVVTEDELRAMRQEGVGDKRSPMLLRIVAEGRHYLLLREGPNGEFLGDTWHESVEGAIVQARYEYPACEIRWVPAETTVGQTEI